MSSCVLPCVFKNKCVHVFANAYTFVTHSSNKSKCVHIYKQCVRCITCMQVCEYLNVFLCVCVYATSNCLCLFVHVFANAYAFVTHFSNMSKWVHIHYQFRMYKSRIYTVWNKIEPLFGSHEKKKHTYTTLQLISNKNV